MGKERAVGIEQPALGGGNTAACMDDLSLATQQPCLAGNGPHGVQLDLKRRAANPDGKRGKNSGGPSAVVQFAENLK